MDKLRALSIYVRSLRRHLQGSGELIDINHIFYEAEREIKKNGWEDEAYNLFKEELEIVETNLEPVINEYFEYVKTGVSNKEKEAYYNLQFNKLGIDGRRAETIKYLARSGTLPSKEALDEILKEREELSQKYLQIFFKNQAKIYNGEDFNKEDLLSAAQYLKEHGLYEIAIKTLSTSNSCLTAEKLIEGYESGFNFKLF